MKNLISAIIHKRYKRFLADVTIESSGEDLTCYVPNTGSMKNCWAPGQKVLLSESNNPKRKYKYTLEMIHNGQTWIGINTSKTNDIAEEAIRSGTINDFNGFDHIRREVKSGKSRIDILMSNLKGDKCFIEVKNVTLVEEENIASFPDSVTTRGQKHLDELIAIKKSGTRSAMLYIIQRDDVHTFTPAKNIDPKYALKLAKAMEEGVEIYAYKCQLKGQNMIVSSKVNIII